MARVYDAAPNTLTAKIVSYATGGWGSRTKVLHQNELKEHLLVEDKNGGNAWRILQGVAQTTMARGDAGEHGVHRKEAGIDSP